MAMKISDRRYLQSVLIIWLILFISIFAYFLLAADEIHRTNPLLLAFGFFILTVVAAIADLVLFAIPLRIILNLVIKERRLSHKPETFFLSLTMLLFILLAILMLFFRSEVQREQAKLAPPQGINTLPGFAEAMPAPLGLGLLEYDGHEYYIWIGEWSAFPDSPSGPSCYLFDHNGNLLDWQPDSGDGGPVDKFRKNAKSKKEISLREAMDKINESK